MKMFRIGKISPPGEDWVEKEIYDSDAGIYYTTGEYELIEDDRKECWEVWIDCTDAIEGYCSWDGMIQVRGDTEKMAMFLANEVVDRLNDPKVLMKRKLKVGE